MKLGAERKKVVILIGLLAAAGFVYWMNSSPSAPPTPSVARQTAVEPAVAVPVTETAKKRSAGGRPQIVENVYKLAPLADPSKIDPTLHIDLLTKVQSIEPEAGARNLFQIATPPPAPVAAAKPLPSVPGIHPGATPAPMASTQPPPMPAGPPPPPPINLKYYGYSTKNSDGEKKAFFLDGDDIIVASEGEIIKKQYKVVRITTTTVEMEDTTSKTTQKLPIQQEAAPV